MTDKAIDRLLAVYAAAIRGALAGGAGPSWAQQVARAACDDFTDYIAQQREAYPGDRS